MTNHQPLAQIASEQDARQWAFNSLREAYQSHTLDLDGLIADADRLAYWVRWRPGTERVAFTRAELERLAQMAPDVREKLVAPAYAAEAAK